MSSIIPVNPVPLPIGDPIAQSRKPFDGISLAEVVQYLKSQDSSGFITQTWLRFFSNQQAIISASPVRLNSVPLVSQGASIGATDLSSGTISGGEYEIKVYARIVTPAAVSSSLLVSIDWVDKGVTCSEAFAAMTTNTVTTVLTGPSKTIRADPASPIRYSTVYASNPAGIMNYDLILVLLRVQA